jgi:hypothetical protein
VTGDVEALNRVKRQALSPKKHVVSTLVCTHVASTKLTWIIIRHFTSTAWQARAMQMISFTLQASIVSVRQSLPMQLRGRRHYMYPQQRISKSAMRRLFNRVFSCITKPSHKGTCDTDGLEDGFGLRYSSVHVNFCTQILDLEDRGGILAIAFQRLDRSKQQEAPKVMADVNRKTRQDPSYQTAHFPPLLRAIGSRSL